MHTAILNKVQNIGDVDIVSKIIDQRIKDKLIIPEDIDIIKAIEWAKDMETKIKKFNKEKKENEKLIDELKKSLSKFTEIEDKFKEAQDLFTSI